MPRALPSLACLCLLASQGAATETGTGIDRDRAVRLERLVIQDCGSCHGLTLRGGLGRPITADLMQHYDRAVLRDIILDGIPGTAMPPWRPLMTETEAMWIADYLRGVKE